MSRLRSKDGGSVPADTFVFACGPWLGRLFPDVIGVRVRADAPGDAVFRHSRRATCDSKRTALPVWVDFRERLIYGIPGNAHRGFKVADDTAGP